MTAICDMKSILSSQIYTSPLLNKRRRIVLPLITVPCCYLLNVSSIIVLVLLRKQLFFMNKILNICIVVLAIVWIAHSQYITKILGNVGKEYSNPMAVPLRDPSNTCYDSSRNILYISDTAAVYAFDLTRNSFSLVIGL